MGVCVCVCVCVCMHVGRMLSAFSSSPLNWGSFKLSGVMTSSVTGSDCSNLTDCKEV